MLQCLDDLVGYIPETCECLDDVPAGHSDVTVSELGKFLTDLLPSDFITKKCGDATIWTTLDRNRTSAKQDMLIKLTTRLKKNGKTFQPWTGYSGRNDGDAVVSAYTYNGIRYTLTRDYRGIYATIREIMVYSGTSGSKTIKVLDRNGTEVQDDQTITIASGEINRWVSKELTTPIQLQMWSDDDQCAEYNLVWNATNTKSNTRECPTCTGPQPMWKYMEPQGVGSNEPGDHDSFTQQQHLSGLRPYITIECSFENLLCNARGDSRIAAGICLWYAWAINSLQYAINSGEINLWTSLGGEYLEGLLTNHTARYDENMTYLVEVLNTEECLKCNPRIQRGSIRV